MNSRPRRTLLGPFGKQTLSLFIATILFVAPICAQRPAAPARTPPRAPEPTFDNLLAADRYKLYGEVRNVGQLMSTGGAAEIVDPIIKLADPPPQLISIVKFLKGNAEALATTRLLFATWPARNDVPDTIVAIEFASTEEASKFYPKLEKFLPTVLPPVPVPTPESSASPATLVVAGTSPTGQQPVVAEPKKAARPSPTPGAMAAPSPAAEQLPFVITHSGSLVLISDKAFKFEKLHPVESKGLAEDQNFRIAHDRFSTEPFFLFFNVALEEKQKPATTKQVATETQAATDPVKPAQPDTDDSAEEAAKAGATPTPNIDDQNEQRVAVLSTRPEPSPTPTPTKEQQAQTIATTQIGHMLDSLGYGEPQWPEAVGMAVALDNNDYVIKAILLDAPDAKRLPLPFVPQLISGPSYATNAASVLPEDTEVFVSASIDFPQTYEAMRKAADKKAKAEPRDVPAGGKEPPLDEFSEFEKKGGLKIKDDLLPVFGNEMALAGSLKALQSAGINAVPGGAAAKPSPEAGDANADKEKNGAGAMPMLLISVRDREAARRIMPRILDGLGLGEVNLIAQVEKREDTEMVNYGGVFAYAFVGDFVVISEAATVRHVIDANINHQTLASNSAFRNSRRWEPNRTLGQIYVSPSLMEAYHEEVRKGASSITDPALRDFLLGLDPTATAITYALSNEGLGTQHELHLPKNLIITMVAGASSATKNPPPEMNEGIAMGELQMIYNLESTYLATDGKGKYGTLDDLRRSDVGKRMLTNDMFEKYGYNFEVTASGDQFEALATPREYGKTGTRSFFVDKSGVVRGGDHGGAPASLADKPVQ